MSKSYNYIYKIATIIYLMNWSFNIIFIGDYNLNNSSNLINIIGGIPVFKYGIIDYYATIKWFLVIIPPVAISCIYLIFEIDKLYIFTFHRHKSKICWCLSKIKTIVLLNCLYIMIPTIYCIFIASTMVGHFFVLLLYTTLISLTCLFVYLIANSVCGLVIVYFGYNLSSFISALYPDIAKYQIGLYGMSIRTEINLPTSYSVLIISLIAVSVSICIVVKQKKSS